jgi:hypothetical protein
MSDHQDWKTPRFLWIDAFRLGDASPDDPEASDQQVGYHGIQLRRDADGDYLGAGILEDRRRGLVCSVGVQVKIADHVDQAAVVRLLRKLADYLAQEAIWSLMEQARGTDPITLDLTTIAGGEA